jgi:hypothetical protein
MSAGPDEAILMALAGRDVALKDLEGDGVEELAPRDLAAPATTLVLPYGCLDMGVARRG